MSNSEELKKTLALLKTVKTSLETTERWTRDVKQKEATLLQRRADIAVIEKYVRDSRFAVQLVETEKNAKIRKLQTDIKVLEGKIETLKAVKTPLPESEEYPDSLTF